MYEVLRKYGITASFVLHWLIYYFALFNNFMDWGFNGKLSYSLQWGSLPLLGIGVAVTFAKCMDDCDVSFLWACIFSMTLRFIIILLKPWGFETSANVMIFCAIAMPIFFVIECVHKRSKDNYFKY